MISVIVFVLVIFVTLLAYSICLFYDNINNETNENNKNNENNENNENKVKII